MIEILMIAACLYFAYSNVMLLITVPVTNWQLEQYLLVLITVALLVVAGMKGFSLYKRRNQPANGPNGQNETPKQPEEPAQQQDEED